MFHLNTFEAPKTSQPGPRAMLTPLGNDTPACSRSSSEHAASCTIQGLLLPSRSLKQLIRHRRNIQCVSSVTGSVYPLELNLLEPHILQVESDACQRSAGSAVRVRLRISLAGGGGVDGGPGSVVPRCNLVKDGCKALAEAWVSVAQMHF